MSLEINKIYLGDANELIKELPDNSCQMIYTDIPYLYHCGGGGTSAVALRIRKNYNGLANADIDKGIDYNIFNEFARVMKKVNLYIWCSKMQIFDIANWWLKYAQENNINLFYEILCWGKTNPTPATNNTWLPDIEYCLYFREEGVKLNDGYEKKHKFYVSGLNVEDKNDYGHPTCKPLEFVEKNIAHTCNKDDPAFILDPYVGSGTTTLAAKHLGLNYIGFEINEKFYKIATDRMKGLNQKGQFNLFDIE